MQLNKVNCQLRECVLLGRCFFIQGSLKSSDERYVEISFLFYVLQAVGLLEIGSSENPENP